MSGYNAFADPLPIRERLFELSVEETELLKEVYAKFGSGTFDTNEFNEICYDRGLSVRRLDWERCEKWLNTQKFE